MNDPRNELHASYTYLQQRELNSDIATRKRPGKIAWDSRKAGCTSSLSHPVHIVYSKMDVAKEFPHRDESGTAETVCCPISIVWLHWLLHATSATFFGRNISISLAVRECCGTYSRRTNQTKSMRSIRTSCTF